jgi:hypothetical protein
MCVFIRSKDTYDNVRKKKMGSHAATHLALQERTSSRTVAQVNLAPEGVSKKSYSTGFIVWFLVFGLVDRHIASNPITEEMHTSGVQ